MLASSHFVPRHWHHCSAPLASVQLVWLCLCDNQIVGNCLTVLLVHVLYCFVTDLLISSLAGRATCAPGHIAKLPSPLSPYRAVMPFVILPVGTVRALVLPDPLSPWRYPYGAIQGECLFPAEQHLSSILPIDLLLSPS